MITLYYHPGNASLAPHIVLREIGAEFDLARVDRANNAHKSPEYLKLNPNGLIPVLVDGELVLYESAAICMHLADTHPLTALLPPLASAERALTMKWLIWMSNTLQVALMHYFYPERWLDVGNVEGAQQIRAHAVERVHAGLQQLDDQLDRHGGPWLLGDRYTVADPYALMLCRWTRGFSVRPARDFTQLGPYLQRMLERPAVQAALTAEGITPPVV